MPKAKHLGTDPEPNALIPLNKRDGAYVNLTAPLWTGCPVALLYRNKRFKPKFGRYYPGPPVEFAEFVDPWDNSPDAAISPIKRCWSSWGARTSKTTTQIFS